jgi:hypothetical protein
MTLVEAIEWFITIWLTLAAIKIILIWGQLNDFTQCYAKVFKVEYSGQLMWNIFIAVPIIVSVTAPILFLAEGWRFVFLYTKDDITKHLTDIRDQMSQM